MRQPERPGCGSRRPPPGGPRPGPEGAGRRPGLDCRARASAWVAFPRPLPAGRHSGRPRHAQAHAPNPAAAPVPRSRAAAVGRNAGRRDWPGSLRPTAAGGRPGRRAATTGSPVEEPPAGRRPGPRPSRVPAGRVLLQALQADRLQVAGHRRVQRAGRRPARRCSTWQQRVERRSPPGTAAGRSGTRTGSPRGRTRRPPGRPPWRPRGPAPGPCSSGVPSTAPVRGQARPPTSSRLASPKSVTFGRAVGGQQDVGRLQVAVDDAPVVGGVRRPGPAARPAAAASRAGSGVPAELRRPGCRRGRTPGRGTAAAVGLADLVDLDDVRVAAAGRPPRPPAGTGARRAWPPARIIFRATSRSAGPGGPCRRRPCRRGRAPPAPRSRAATARAGPAAGLTSSPNCRVTVCCDPSRPRN